RYFAKTSIYPINHCLVVRRSIAEQHPWVILNLFSAFRDAKEGYLNQLRTLAEGHLATGLLPADARKALQTDPFPYGVKSNRHVLETIATYSNEQGLTPRVIDLSEVFAPNTLDL